MIPKRSRKGLRPEQPLMENLFVRIDAVPGVAGADEAGAGALAGPVVAAAVILGKTIDWGFLRDSKVLSPSKRVEFATIIQRNAIAWALAFVSHHTIDKINILNARLLAMRKALELLACPIDLALIDGNRVPCGRFAFPVESVVDGDSIVPEISAASILAKTARDAWMTRAAKMFIGYGFEAHFGYATRFHKERLAEYGPCPIHRVTFAPVREVSATVRARVGSDVTLDLH